MGELHQYPAAVGAVDQHPTRKWRKVVPHEHYLRAVKRQAQQPSSSISNATPSTPSKTITPFSSSLSRSADPVLASPSSLRAAKVTTSASHLAPNKFKSKVGEFGVPIRTDTAAGVSGTSIWQFPGQQIEVQPWGAVPVLLTILIFLMVTVLHLIHAVSARRQHRQRLKEQQHGLIASAGPLAGTADALYSKEFIDELQKPQPFDLAEPPSSPFLDVAIPRCKISFDVRRHERFSIAGDIPIRPFERRPRGSVVVAYDEFGHSRKPSSIQLASGPSSRRHSRARSSLSDRLSTFIPTLPGQRKNGTGGGKPSRLRFDLPDNPTSYFPSHARSYGLKHDSDVDQPEQSVNSHAVKSSLSLLPIFISNTRFRDHTNYIPTPSPSPPPAAKLPDIKTNHSPHAETETDVGTQWATYPSNIPAFVYDPPTPGLIHNTDSLIHPGMHSASSSAFPTTPSPLTPVHLASPLPSASPSPLALALPLRPPSTELFILDPTLLQRRPSRLSAPISLLDQDTIHLARTPSGKKWPGSQTPEFLSRQNTLTVRSPIHGTMPSGGTKESSSFHHT